MKQQVSPTTAVIIIVVLLAVIGGYFVLQSRRGAKETEAISKKGQDAGRKMMEGMKGMGGTQ